MITFIVQYAIYFVDTYMRSKFCLLLLLALSLSCSSQNKESNAERLILGREYAEKELKKSLSDSLLHNVVGSRILIDKEENAIKIAEAILFPIYTEENIVRQRPYESYRINNYWVISGTLPTRYLGGTFLIILDARDGKVIRITHGK